MNKVSASLLVPFEDRISSYYKKHQAHIHLFLFLLAVNVFIYGQRLVGFILSTDDLLRMMVGSDAQLSYNKRWFNWLIGTTILGGERHVLLFFNAAVGVFSITLAGFITAFLFEAKRKTHIAVITLLCSTTPAWAFQMYYSTNTVVLMSTAWAMFGIYAWYRYKKIGKIVGFILMLLAVGTYQSAVMVVAAVACVRAMIRCMRAEAGAEILRALLQSLYLMAAAALAYIASNAINEAILLVFFHEKSAAADYITPRLPTSVHATITYASEIVKNFFSVYSPYHQNWYKALGVLLTLSAAAAGVIFLRSGRHKNRALLAWKAAVFALFFVEIFLIKEFSRLVGLNFDNHVRYVMGWIAAGLFVVPMLWAGKTNLGRAVHNASFLVEAFILVLNIFTINVFFFMAQRETQVDIIRVNQMVTSIRENKNYPGEETPLKLIVLGLPPGMQSNGGQYFWPAFSPRGSHGLFTNYTDLNFIPMTDEEFVRLQPRMRERADEIKAYPRPEFVYIDGRNVVLFLDAEEVLKNRLEAVYKTKDEYPVIARGGGFDIFVSQDAVCYFSPALSAEAKSDPAFLQIVPVDAQALSAKKDRKNGFTSDNFSFASADTKERDNGEPKLFTCKELPSYPIKMMRTGQYEPVGSMQKVRFILGEISRRKKESGGLVDFAASLKQLAAEVKTSAPEYPWQRWSVTISGEELRRAQAAQQQ